MNYTVVTPARPRDFIPLREWLKRSGHPFVSVDGEWFAVETQATLEQDLRVNGFDTAKVTPANSEHLRDIQRVLLKSKRTEWVEEV